MFQSIVVPLDVHEGEECKRISDAVVALFSSQECVVHLLTVLPHDEGLGVLKQFVPEGFAEKLNDEANALLADMANSLATAGIACTKEVASGNVYVETLAATERHNADMVILGAGRDELKDYLLGPSAARVVRHANCSVLVVRP